MPSTNVLSSEQVYRTNYAHESAAIYVGASTSPIQSCKISCSLTTYWYCPCLCVYAVIAFAFRLLLDPALMGTVVREDVWSAESVGRRGVTVCESRGDKLAHFCYAGSCWCCVGGVAVVRTCVRAWSLVVRMEHSMLYRNSAFEVLQSVTVLGSLAHLGHVLNSSASWVLWSCENDSMTARNPAKRLRWLLRHRSS